MHNMKRRVMGSLMAVLMSASTILGTCPTPIFAAGTQTAASEKEVVADASQTDGNSYGLVSVTQGNILHAWDWKFTDVTKNIKDIAEAGYSIVQVSPCQVCEDLTTNNEWWKLYQPYDYKFGNALGSEDEFKEMCDTAEEYGVSIVVDVVANHMAGTGTGACEERKPEVDKWWTDDKFHKSGVKFTGTYDNDREKMVRSNIGMPDIATEREDVQGRMIDYLNTMLDMGADGFRYDAAKHIGTTSDTGEAKDTFWKNISEAVAKKRPDALVYGEILNGMPVSDEYYVKDGIKVTESQKGWNMKDLLQKGGSSAAYVDNGKEVTFKDLAFTYQRKASDNKLITWVENHDTYLNHWVSTGLVGNSNYMSDDQIMLGWSTVGARANAQALYFARPDGCSNPDDPGNPDASNKIQGSLGMSTQNFDWKNQKVAAVNKFKNAMVGEGETLSTQNDMAIIQRGTKGVVVTNFSKEKDDTVTISGLNGLADGTYKDASGQNADITVSGGKATISVKKASFVVLYDEKAVPVVTDVPTTTKPAESDDANDTDKPIVTESASVNTPDPDGTETADPDQNKTDDPNQTETEAPTPTASTDADADTDGDNQKPNNTTTPEHSQNKKTTIGCSEADGQKFSDETMDVVLTANNATEASYSLDGGPTQKFTGSTVVTVGEGMIADQKTELKVTATGANGTVEKTYTFEKVFDSEKAAQQQTIQKTATASIQSLFEVVADAAEVEAEGLSGSPKSSYFATNPKGQTGSKKTITQAADFTEDMIIAQGVANDGVTSFKGTHEGPVYDSYAMFGAYDDSNIYIGVQYVNVIDVIDPAQGYPISDNGKPYNGSIPQMMVFNAGTGDYTDGTANDAVQKTAWDLDVKFAGDAKVDYIYTYAAKAEDNNKALFPVTDKIVDYNKVMFSKEGTDSGITYQYEDGFFCSKMNGIQANGYDGYTPADLNSDSGKWVDFLETSHDTDKDTFMLMTVPMSALGVTADQVASQGIGVMSISTFGESGIGSLPQDLTMLDNVSGDYVSKKGSSDPSTSMEKADSDVVTVKLARLGGTADSEPVIDPTEPTDPTDPPESDDPEVTDPVESDDPMESDDPTESDAPDDDKTDAPTTTAPAGDNVTEEPTETESANPTTTAPAGDSDQDDVEEVEKTPTPIITGSTDRFVVNFGATKSSPQKAGEELTLKAAAYNTDGVAYEFSVDGTVIQEASGTDECQWTGTAGKHTIQVKVEDEEGQYIVVKKSFTLQVAGTVNTTTEQPQVTNTVPPVNVGDQSTQSPSGQATQAPQGGQATATPAPAVPTPTVQAMTVNLKMSKPSPQKVNTVVDLTPIVEGGSGSYTYKITAHLKDSTETQVIADETASTVSNPAITAWKPAAAGEYQLDVTVTDKKDTTVKATCTKNYTITKATTTSATKKLAIKKIKVNSKKIKLGKKLNISVTGTAKKGTIKYKFTAKKGSKVKTLRKYSAKKTLSWKPTKVGTYKITVYATDSSKKVVKKSFNVKVKK